MLSGGDRRPIVGNQSRQFNSGPCQMDLPDMVLLLRLDATQQGATDWHGLQFSDASFIDNLFLSKSQQSYSVTVIGHAAASTSLPLASIGPFHTKSDEPRTQRCTQGPSSGNCTFSPALVPPSLAVVYTGNSLGSVPPPPRNDGIYQSRVD